MKKKFILLAGLGVLSSIFFGCRTPNRTTDYTFTLNDSLWVQRRTVDSIVKVPYSYLPLIILPGDIKEGERIEKKKDQANLIIEKKGDTLFIEASCDSLQLVIQGMEETLINVRKENQELHETVKAAPNKWKWFFIGFFAAGVLFIFRDLKTNRK